MVVALDITSNKLVTIPGDDPDGLLRFSRIDAMCARIIQASKVQFAWFVQNFGQGILWTSGRIKAPSGKMKKVDMFFYSDIDMSVLKSSDDYQDYVCDMLQTVVGRGQAFYDAYTNGTFVSSPGAPDLSDFIAQGAADEDALDKTAAAAEDASDLINSDMVTLKQLRDELGLSPAKVRGSGAKVLRADLEVYSKKEVLHMLKQRDEQRAGGVEGDEDDYEDEPVAKRSKKSHKPADKTPYMSIAERIAIVEAKNGKGVLDPVPDASEKPTSEKPSSESSSEKPSSSDDKEELFKGKLIEMQSKLDAERRMREKAEKNHIDYKKRQAKERSQWALDKKSLEESKEKTETLLQEANTTAQAALNKYSSALQDPSAAVKKDCKDFYLNMIARFKQAYTDKAALSPSSSSASKAMFQFMENGDQWVDIHDDILTTKLQSIQGPNASSKIISYTIGNNSYTAAYDPSSGEIAQTNVSTSVVRRIRVRAAPTQAELDDVKKKQLLFGNSIVLMKTSEATMWMNEYDQNQPQTAIPCKELAELAEIFSSFGSGFKYGSDLKLKHLKTELFIKPFAVWQWLKYAASRGYTHVRLVMHGGSSAEYKSIRSDPFGFNMRHAGRNGTAVGHGIYMGLSDHICVSYNKEGKDGTGILSLLLTDENVHDPIGSMKTYELPPRNNSSNPKAYEETQGQSNAMCVYETPLILVLGKVVAV